MAGKKIREVVPKTEADRMVERVMDDLTENPLGDIQDPTGYVPEDDPGDLAERIINGKEEW